MHNTTRRTVPCRLLFVTAAAALTLASCGTSEPTEPTTVAEAATEADPTTEPETESTSEAEASPSEEPETNGPPEACTVAEPETALGEAITSVDLPETATIATVQELGPDSDVDQSLMWVRIDLCSEPLSEKEHRTIATDIAIAARDAEGGGDQIWRVSVGLYAPDDAGTLKQDRTLFVEGFSTYTWERDAARAPESIWEETGV